MRLDEFPRAGKVAVGNPDQESGVEAFASDQRLDYCLSPHAPVGQVFIVDVGMAFSLSCSWAEPDADPLGDVAAAVRAAEDAAP